MAEKDAQNGSIQAKDPLQKEVKAIADSKTKSSALPDIDSKVADIQKSMQVEQDIEKVRQLNQELEAEIIKQEQLKARAMLGGKSDAGDQEKSAEEIAEEEAKDILSKFR